MILGVKLSRRLVAFVGLTDEAFVFRDSRYLRAHQTQGDAVRQYFTEILTSARPDVVYYFAPADAGPVTAQLIKLLEEVAASLQTTVKPLTKYDLYSSLGITPARSREEVLRAIGSLWPELSESKAPRRPALAEAATAALLGACLQDWPPA